MHWYLIHSKPKQERVALENLERQGYECYLPLMPVEKVQRRQLKIVIEPLFPRYLFIRLGEGETAKSWIPIRSTKGVSKLVTFGLEPAKVDDLLIEMLQTNEHSIEVEPERLYHTGEQLEITEGPFAGIQGVYQMMDGEQRAMLLIELLQKPTTISVSAGSLRKVS